VAVGRCAREEGDREGGMFQVRARGGWVRVTRGFCSARVVARGRFAAQPSATAARAPKDPACALFSCACWMKIPRRALAKKQLLQRRASLQPLLEMLLYGRRVHACMHAAPPVRSFLANRDNTLDYIGLAGRPAFFPLHIFSDLFFSTSR
jgi:hypothetical protein